MIGGYIYNRVDETIQLLLRSRLGQRLSRIPVWDKGYFFHDEPFGSDQTNSSVSDELIALSHDILVKTDSGGKYRMLNLEQDFSKEFSKRQGDSLDDIASDFRMALAYKRRAELSLFLISNRAGSGRIYYSELGGGIVFSSDLRLLIRTVGFQRNDVAAYSILKYGAAPEPLTISEAVSAVPPGHYLKYNLETGKSSLHCYYKFKFEEVEGTSPPADHDAILEPVRRALQKSARFSAEKSPVMLLSGGIDSSLYGCYLRAATKEPLEAFYCAFGEEDPELQFARDAGARLGADLRIIHMGASDGLGTLDDVAGLTDHPFSDFSSLPVAFLLKRIREEMGDSRIVIECNGGDDCFGFSDLITENKFRLKHQVPAFLKRGMSSLLRNYPHWKWEGEEGFLARLSALSDVHEGSVLNYFMVLAPMNLLGRDAPREWDETIFETMEDVFSGCAENYEKLSYKAKVTIRQLLHVNSRRWAAKALSVGESLGLRVVYPYIWREVLDVQGELPWSAKIHNGVVKWPLKKLLEEFMPKEFIYRKKSGFVPPFAKWLTQKDFNYRIRDILSGPGGFVTDIVPRRIFEELLEDALNGRRLRHSILNFLWGAVFTEMWIRECKRAN